MGYSIDCLGHLTNMTLTPYMVNKICFNNNPKLTLTYFYIIKEIRRALQALVLLCEQQRLELFLLFAIFKISG